MAVQAVVVQWHDWQAQRTRSGQSALVREFLGITWHHVRMQQDCGHAVLLLGHSAMTAVRPGYSQFKIFIMHFAGFGRRVLESL